MEPTIEIRRERVYVPIDLSVKELMEKYHISSTCASNAREKGWITKNYRIKQVIIDRDNFHPGYSYTIAKKVFRRSFSRNPVALSIKDDLIQEAVTRMFELSGKVKENANERYNIWYGYYWVAHNAMLSYLKTWIRQVGDCESMENVIHPMLNQRRRYSPELGWIYC
jgi:hypothetical protein